VLSLWNVVRLCENQVGWVIDSRHLRAIQFNPGLTSCVIFCRPRATSSGQALRDLSCYEPKTQHFVLGYFQPSLRDWYRHTLRAVLFQQVPAEFADQKKLIWTSLVFTLPAKSPLKATILRLVIPTGAQRSGGICGVPVK
jgi:hypothetical protein